MLNSAQAKWASGMSPLECEGSPKRPGDGRDNNWDGSDGDNNGCDDNDHSHKNHTNNIEYMTAFTTISILADGDYQS